MFNCMHVVGSLSCQTLWIFPVSTKNTVLITQYKMINLKLRFRVSQLDNLVYLVLHPTYYYIVLNPLVLHPFHIQLSQWRLTRWSKGLEEN